MRLIWLPYVRRLVAWRLLLAAMAPVAAVVVVAARLSEMHWTFLALSAGLAVTVVLDDPAALTLASSPASLWRRRMHRLSLGLPTLVIAAAPTAWYLHAHTTTAWLDGGLELAATVTVGLALAALALRRNPDVTASAVAAPLVVLAVGVGLAVNGRWSVHPVGTHRLAWLVAAVAAAVVVWVASADPAARS